MTEPEMIHAGTGEKMQYLAHEYNDNTIRFILHYPKPLDPQIMEAAARALAESVEVLHASFQPGKVEANWQVNEDYSPEDYFLFVKTQKEPSKDALERALVPVKPQGKAQLFVSLIQNDSESAVVLTVSHLCVDGGDGKYLLKKLTQAYNLILETGNAEGLQVKNGSRAAEQMYEQMSKKEVRSLMKNPLTGVKNGFPFPDSEPGSRRLVAARIPEEVLHAASQRAKAEGATVNDLLLTAAYHAYASMPGIKADEPMSIMSFLDLRRYCENGDSQGLSNLSGSLPTQLAEGVCSDFKHTLKNIAQQTRSFKNVPHAGMEGLPILHSAARAIPLGILQKMVGSVYGQMSLGMTNLGAVSGRELALGDCVPQEILFGGPLKKKPGMQISAMTLEGRGTLCVATECTDKDAALLSEFLERMVDELTVYGLGNRME